MSDSPPTVNSTPPPVVEPTAAPPSDSPKPNPPLASGIQQKPKNLENAMWVGNLPTDTTPEELRDFFYDEDFLTVFHISKTHCAFVNYKSYEAVLRAVKKHHEAEFHGIKLVCRPRKQNHLTARGMVASPRHLHTSQTSSSDAMPMLPPPMMYLPQGGVTGSMRFNQYPGDPRFHTLSTMPPTSIPQQVPSPGTPADYRPRRTSQLSRSSRDSSPRSAQPPPSPQERHPSIDSNASNPSVRYFILKSLTADDLDISVERGVWATQPHNEASLNRAFKTSSAVYLIFSANKSGEFYGYARMLQPIVSNPPSSPSTQVQWTPVAIEEDEEEGGAPDHVNPPPEPVEEDAGNEKRWGNAFKVQWIKVQRLPFSQTRHLRNSWNNNREVKVSRDGTELETAVGEMLLQGFHWAEQQQLYQQQPPPPQAPPPPSYQPMMYNTLHVLDPRRCLVIPRWCCSIGPFDFIQISPVKSNRLNQRKKK
ncbi:hypothetical protein K450DRAFT_253927 [Umbelopsis ramanniana AG]|uniref:YTH domain-containing protein n=1 Tax=Umbelopsis ramanniana AG TaxID=1314678 RepID=A0AAD5HBM9_UMBRA|nr:uncharacterized protein K450DRAFT_253927 [Umbelopsis ramanniana AG]KAI8577004.1 hypothetical protein K450DRAFT_253927 [Umbelopsis ramanniana AG]